MWGEQEGRGGRGWGSFKKRFKKGASGEVEAEEAAPEINIGARWLTKLYSLASTASLSLSLPRRRKGLSRPKWWFALE